MFPGSNFIRVSWKKYQTAKQLFRHKIAQFRKIFSNSWFNFKKSRNFGLPVIQQFNNTDVQFGYAFGQNTMDYRAAKQFIIDKLRDELSEDLVYHGIHHTLDVLKMAAEIAESEGVDEHNLLLLKTAAVYHDCGFIKNKHNGHEEVGCQIVREHLPGFGYEPTDIEVICSMIMATKIPQSPKNLLEEILCDADLDYLGRKDFFQIGRTLYQELHAYHLLNDEQAWNRLQVNFLSNHRFHTTTNKLLREPVKLRYLEDLKELVASYV